MLCRLILPTLYLVSLFVPPTAVAEYIAETGRIESIAVPDLMSQSSGSALSDSGPAFEVPMEELYSKEVADVLASSGIDRLAVQTDGVNTTLRTWAELQVHAVTGKSALKLAGGTKISPLYMALGMVYQNKLWVRAPILPLESPVLGKLFEMPAGKGVRVAPTTIMRNKTARTLVMAALSDNQPGLAGLTDEQKKLVRRFGSHLAAFLNMPGELRLMPTPSEPTLWISPIHIHRPELLHSEDLAEQIRALNLHKNPFKPVLALDQALTQTFDYRKANDLRTLSRDALIALSDTPGYTSALVRRIDYLKTGIKPYQKASWVFLVAFVVFLAYLVSTRRRTDSKDSVGGTSPPTGVVSGEENQELGIAPVLAAMARQEFALAGVTTGSIAATAPVFFHRTMNDVDPVLKAEGDFTRGNRTLWRIAYGLLVAGASLLLGALIARFALGGRMPVSNMFEAVTFALSAFALLAVVMEGILRRGWIGIFGAFFGWTLMMAVNLMPIHAKKVEPLIAVLDSIWLNYHVTALLVSYACFLLAMGCSVIQVAKLKLGNRPGLMPRAELFEHLAFRSTQVGWPLLTFGIFLGAVWANTAWGSYWSWDPKETWALITWFVYTIYLHIRMIVGWKDQRAGWVNILGFVMVLITFFGVSYLPGLAGGMHSYANPISR